MDTTTQSKRSCQATLRFRRDLNVRFSFKRHTFFLPDEVERLESFNQAKAWYSASLGVVQYWFNVLVDWSFFFFF